MRPLLPAGIALLLACPFAAMPSPPACPTLAQPPAPHCMASARGWFYARTPQQAAEIAADAAIAAERFERYFSRPAPPGAVIASGTSTALAEDGARALRAQGARWLLPWLDEDDRRTMLASRIRQRLRDSLPGASEERIETALRAALSASPPQDAAATVRSALRHEVGHLLLIHTFWPDDHERAPPARTGAHYGGPAPDWLDEVAAVLMESDAMTEDRRKALREPAVRARLLPLAEFFTAVHPLKARVGELGPSQGAGITVLTGEQAKGLADAAIWFYAQARGVADFLIETSGREAIFGDIAASSAAGIGTADWLHQHGAGDGLPGSVEALDAAWQSWLERSRGSSP